MKKNIVLVMMMALSIAMLGGCASKKNDTVTVIYTNDVHSYVHNMEELDDGTQIPALSYASVAAMKKNIASDDNHVFLVDAGDEVSGTVYGAIDEGVTVQKLMELAEYDVATFGNHEFDYGQFRALDILQNSIVPYVSCNLYDIENDKLLLPAYKIFDAGNIKIAFVGITTPETFTEAAPAYFQNEKGEFIFKIYAGEDGRELYDAVQRSVDEARKEADYVIALGHCGVDESAAPYRSTDIIANVSGLDAFIDGHSHTEMIGEMIKDKDGKDVLLTQTGSYFKHIGKMTIKDGMISTEFVNDYPRDEYLDDIEADLNNRVEEEMGTKIATSPIDFYITDSEYPDARLVRAMETNMGDLVADSIYWYFNEHEKIDCDVAMQNGGGIRADVPAGDWTYIDAKKINPFGNVCCLVEVSGQDILDCLEYGAYLTSVYDGNNSPEEFGGFMQVSGLTYEIDTSVESTVSYDEKGTWQGAPSGEYRVKNVKIYNKDTKTYEDIDLNKTYRVGGINYILRNGGNGMVMFDDAVLVKDYVGEDYLIFAEYLMAFDNDASGIPCITGQGSPLSAYENFKINYENPLSAQRILVH